MSEEVPVADSIAPALDPAESETPNTPSPADRPETAEAEAAAAAVAEPVANEATAPEEAAPEADGSVVAEAAAPEVAAPEAATAEASESPAAEPDPVAPEATEAPQPPASEDKTPLPSVQGTVIGWNDGGFHVVVDGKTGFCPRSEMAISDTQEPKELVDETFIFSVLRIENKGRRIVLSRRAQVRGERREAVGKLRGEMEQGEVLTGTVASLKDFGAFIDLGGVQGLLHVSEISRRRVENPAEVLTEGQEVQVKILKIEQGGRRISLSMKALEPDPWRDAAKQFPQGSVVKGIVERTANFGAFVEIAPGLTGLLPTSNMSLPRNASAARVYHPGKEVTVQIVSVDPRRRRVSLGLEGSGTEGSQADLDSFRKQQAGETSSFNALAAALEKARSRSAD